MSTVTKLSSDEAGKLSKTIDQFVASKTSKALSDMFSEPIRHSVKILNEGISNINKIEIKSDEITMCGIRLNGRGDTHIEICYTMKTKHAQKIAAKLLCQEDVPELDEMGTSAIQEVANIMTGSFFNAITDRTGFRVDLSTPDFAQGELESLVRVCAREVIHPMDKAVITDAEFEGEKSGFKIHMMIIQDPENARKLIYTNMHESSQSTIKNVKKSDVSLNDEYFIGTENSELDDIVNQALSGGSP